MKLPNPPEAGDKYRILVVEDDRNIARMIAVNLIQAGFETFISEDGEAGLARFAEIDPHLILSDIMMPHMNGPEMCAKIRESSAVPIIIMTAADSDETQMESLKIGADDYVPKPFNPKLLVARVVVNLRRVYRYTPASEAPPTAAPSAAVQTPAASESQDSRSHWPICAACGYLGPLAKFQTQSSDGSTSTACPACSSKNISFPIG